MKCLRIGIILLAAALFAFGTNSANAEHPDRYYRGIGVEVATFTPEILGIGEELRNDDGAFNDLTAIVAILSNSPAADAQLKRGDIILSVNGHDIRSEQELYQRLQASETGESVHLKVRRLDPATRAISEEFEKYIALELIDRVRWIPLDRIIGGSLKTDAATINFRSKVREEKDKNTFVYWYQIENKGTEEVMVRWEILDLAAYGRRPFMRLHPLKPGEFKEFTLEVNEYPTYIGGMAQIVKPIQQWLLKHQKETYGFTAQQEGDWSVTLQSSMPGFIPAARVNHGQRD